MAEFDQARDATRRTRLANERTYLAWWRTGLATLAVSVGTGKIVPAVSGGAAWPYEALGVAFAVVGLAFMIYAFAPPAQRRSRARPRASTRRSGSSPPSRFAVVGALLAIGTIAIVLFNS